MAKKSRMSMLKRQREQRKNEKAARKRAKRHGLGPADAQPKPTIRLSDLAGAASPVRDEPEEGPTRTVAAAKGADSQRS